MNHACLSHSILLTLVFVHHMNNIWMMMMMMIIIIRWMREFLSIYSFEKNYTSYYQHHIFFCFQILPLKFYRLIFWVNIFSIVIKKRWWWYNHINNNYKKIHFFFVDNNRWSRFFSSSSSSILIHFECYLLLLLSPSLLRDLLLR